MKKFNFSRESFFLTLIILFGAFLRLYKIKDYIVFLGDEGRDALVVYNILHGHLTLLGPTSSVGGFFLGPIYYYFMAPFLLLFRYDPVGPAVMVALVGLATIYLVYRIGKEFFGSKAGLIASLLYAVSPIVIIYSRSSWNPNVFPFFTVLSLHVLYKAVSKNKLWLFVLTGILMGINLQIHYLATFVGAIMFAFVLFADFKPKVYWLIEILKRYVLMFAGFLIGFSPFLLFEARHQFANSRHIVDFIFNSPETGVGMQFNENIKFVIERLFGGLVISFPTLANFKNFDSNLIHFWLISSFVIAIISVGFFVWMLIKNYKNKNEFLKYLLFLAWLVLGIGLFAFYKKSIYDYYLGFLFPLPFLLIGLVLANVWDKFKTVGKVIVATGLVLMVLISLNFTQIKSPGNQQVNQMKSISEFVLSKTNNESFNFAIITGGNSDHAYRYFFKLENHDPVIIEGLYADPERKSVTNQLFVVCEVVPCSPLGDSSQEIAGFGRAEIADHWKVNVVEVYKLVHYAGQ